MNQLPGLSDHSNFLNPTSNPMGTGNIQGKLVATHGKVGSMLATDRAANVHLSLLSKMMGGRGRLDVTHGGFLSLQLSREARRLHLPVLYQRAKLVEMGGVKYAPLQAMVWSKTASGESGFVAQDAVGLLENQLRLAQPAIKVSSPKTQARLLGKVAESWRTRHLQLIRYRPRETGGALPYFLSKQLAFQMGNEGLDEPRMFQLARSVEEQITEAISGVTGDFGRRMAPGQVGEWSGRGLKSFTHVQRGLKTQLALALEVMAEPGVKSVGTSSVRLKGFDFLGGDARVETGEEGRILASSIPAQGYGVHVPVSFNVMADGTVTDVSGPLSKGIHHMRMRMFLPTERVLEAQERSTKYGQRGPIISAFPSLRNTWEKEAQISAYEHYAHMGAVPKGVKVQGSLSAPMRVLGVAPRKGLQGTQLAAVYKVMNMMFADSAFIMGEDHGVARVLNTGREYKRLPHLPHGVISGGKLGERSMHPLIEAEIRKQGVGGEVWFETPLRKADLVGGEQASATGRKFKTTEGWIGTSLYETGVVRRKGGSPLMAHLSGNEELLGMRYTGKGWQPLIRRELADGVEHGTGLTIGPIRTSVQGVNEGLKGTGFAGAMAYDLPGVGAQPHGLGLGADDINLRMDHLVNLVGTKGEAELKRLAKIMNTATRGRGGIGAQVESFDVPIGGARKRFHTITYSSEDALTKQESVEILNASMKRWDARVDLATGARDADADAALHSFLADSASPRRDREIQRVLKAAGLSTNVAEQLSGHSIFANIGVRGNLPERGTIGDVWVRMRDLNRFAVQIFGVGGNDVKSMFQDLPSAIKRAKDVYGVEPADPALVTVDGRATLGKLAGKTRVRQTERLLHRYRAMWEKRVRGPDFGSGGELRSYLEAVQDIVSGEVKRGSKHYTVITLDEAQKFDPIQNVRTGDPLDDNFRNTMFMRDRYESRTQGMKTTRKKVGIEPGGVYVIEMPEGTTGTFTGKRTRDGAPVATGRYVPYAGGRASGLRYGEMTYLSEGIGDMPGLAHETISLDQAIHGGDTQSIYQASDRAVVSGMEQLVHGAKKSVGFKAPMSMYGTITQNTELELGEAMISQKNFEKMLREAGFTNPEIRERVKRVSSEGADKLDWYSMIQYEPARGTHEQQVVKLRLRQHKGMFGRIAQFFNQSIEVNPLSLPGVHRDVDYDPVSIYNLLGGSRRNLLRDEQAEMFSLRMVHQVQAGQRSAMAKAAEAAIARKATKAAPRSDTTEKAFRQMWADAYEMLSPEKRGRVLRNASLRAQSVAAVQASGHELWTAVANVRWQRSVDIISDIAGGRDFAGDIRNAPVGQQTRLRGALAELKKDTRISALMLEVAEASEYSSALQKKSVEKQLLGLVTGMHDPELVLASYESKVLTAMPGTAEFDKAARHLEDPLRKVLSTVADKGAPVDRWMAEMKMSEPQLIHQLARKLVAARQIEEHVGEGAWRQVVQGFEKADPLKHMGKNALIPLMALLRGREGGLGEILGNTYSGPMREVLETHGAAPPGMSQTAKDITKDGIELANKLRGGKFGKPIMMGMAAVAGIGTVAALWGSNSPQNFAHGASFGGSPLPPPPMIHGPSSDHALDSIPLPSEQMAYMDRPEGHRTHMHFSMNSQNPGTDFLPFTDSVMGEFNTVALQNGQITDDTRLTPLRHQMNAEIQKRMRSSF